MQYLYFSKSYRQTNENITPTDPTHDKKAKGVYEIPFDRTIALR